MEIVDMLQRQANEIARAGHYGWGNTMDEAALCISNLQRQLEEKTRLLAAYEAQPLINWVAVIPKGNGTYKYNYCDTKPIGIGISWCFSTIEKPSTTEHLDALIAEAEKRGERRGMERTAEFERDAVRYRWLKSNHNIYNSDPFIARNFGASFSMWINDEADACVDEAIRKAYNQEEK